jgi:hypothetical protein
VFIHLQLASPGYATASAEPEPYPKTWLLKRELGPTRPRHAVSPGETWVFQAWFADGASSNFTDALVVQFQ